MMLDSFIAAHRSEIIARCRAKVATRSHSVSIDAETEHGVPVFLDQLRSALRSGAGANPETGHTALAAGDCECAGAGRPRHPRAKRSAAPRRWILMAHYRMPNQRAIRGVAKRDYHSRRLRIQPSSRM
jgi:hypothetical protein